MIYSFPSSALNEFRLSEEQIIENFTRNQNGSKQDTPQLVCAPKRDDDPLNEYLHQRPPNEVERRRMPVLAPGRDLAPTDHITLNCNNFGNGPQGGTFASLYLCDAYMIPLVRVRRIVKRRGKKKKERKFKNSPLVFFIR